MVRHALRGILAPLLAISTAALLGSLVLPVRAQEGPFQRRASIVRKIQDANERMEMTVNTSRILSLDEKIPQAQVNNPDLLELTALSPTKVQVSAKKAGVTQINLWSENQQIYTVDVIIYGDAQELTMLLRTQFPNAAVKVVPLSGGVLLSGYVDQPEHSNHIIQIAEEFYPKVISHITVGGVQQVLLHVKVMEVSRTKLRALGFDFAKFTGSNMVASTVSGLIGSVSASALATSGKETFAFSLVDSSSSFFGVLEALREDNLMKVLAEPSLVTISGRPARFQVGGEVPTLVPQSLGTVSVEYKPWGTEVDFVPLVLGNGRIRLEVRPRVSEIDTARSVDHEGYTIYAFNTREVDTGVEMQAGQTLALAGLVQNRVESKRRGLPWVSELPYLGTLFRRVEERNNEVELLILVTPELVDAIDAEDVPQCGPGMMTASPNDWELFMRGHIEVPKCCPACNGAGCPQCASPGRAAASSGQMSMPPEGIILRDPEPTHRSEAARSAPRDGSLGRVPSLAGFTRAVPPPNRHNPSNPQDKPASSRRAQDNGPPGFIGPVGYGAVR